MLTFIMGMRRRKMPNSEALARMQPMFTAFGKPDLIIMFFLEDGAVFAVNNDKTTSQIAVHPRRASHIEGDCLFFLGNNGDGKEDATIREWFERHNPSPGCIARLMEVNTVDTCSIRVITYAGKTA